MFGKCHLSKTSIGVSRIPYARPYLSSFRRAFRANKNTKRDDVLDALVDTLSEIKEVPKKNEQESKREAGDKSSSKRKVDVEGQTQSPYRVPKWKQAVQQSKFEKQPPKQPITSTKSQLENILGKIQQPDPLHKPTKPKVDPALIGLTVPQVRALVEERVSKLIAELNSTVPTMSEEDIPQASAYIEFVFNGTVSNGIVIEHVDRFLVLVLTPIGKCLKINYNTIYFVYPFTCNLDLLKKALTLRQQRLTTKTRLYFSRNVSTFPPPPQPQQSPKLLDNVINEILGDENGPNKKEKKEPIQEIDFKQLLTLDRTDNTKPQSATAVLESVISAPSPPPKPIFASPQRTVSYDNTRSLAAKFGPTISKYSATQNNDTFQWNRAQQLETLSEEDKLIVELFRPLTVWEEQSNVLKMTLKPLHLENLWKQLQQKPGVTMCDAAEMASLLFDTQETPTKLQLYTAIKIMYTSRIYFRVFDHGIYCARTEEEVKELEHLHDKLKEENSCKKFVQLLSEAVIAKDLSASPTNTESQLMNFLGTIEKELEVSTQEEDQQDEILENTEQPALEAPKETLENYQYFLEAIKRYALTRPETEVLDTRFVHQILQPSGILNRYDAFDLLKKLGQLKESDNVHKMRAQRETHLFKDFHEAVHKDANIIAKNVGIVHKELFEVGRDNLGNLVSFAIDSSDTTEVDDAISIEENSDWIHVHTADPTRLFDPESNLDINARHRVASIYLPEGKTTIFPRELATGPMSLIPKQKNAALTFSFLLGADGSIQQSRISTTVVHNLVRINYQQTEDVLNDRPVDENVVGEKYKRLLKRMYELSVRRMNHRKSKGARLVNLPKVKVHVSESGIVSLSRNVDELSNLLVSELMVAANEVAAKYLVDHSIPAIFRVQQNPISFKPVPNELAEMAKLPSFNIWDTTGSWSRQEPKSKFAPLVDTFNLLEGSKLAEHSVVAKPHFGVGLPYYTRATSPIRRYPDDVIHFQLKAHLKGIELPFTEAKLSRLVPMFSKIESYIKTLQQLSERFWKLQYMRQQGPDAHFESVVVEKEALPRNQFKVGIYLGDIGLKGSVILQRDIEIGSQLLVKIVKLSPVGAMFEEALQTIWI